MKSKRSWLGLRVWVADETDGKKRNGTLWWTDEASVLIREDGRTGLVTLPKVAEELGILGARKPRRDLNCSSTRSSRMAKLCASGRVHDVIQITPRYPAGPIPAGI